MRLRQRDLKPYPFKKRVNGTDNDGTTYDGWESNGTINANVLPAGGKLLVEMYGPRLAYMKVAYLERLTNVVEGDGVCVYTAADEPPDYKIVAIRPWGAHFVMDLERVTV